MRVPQVPRKWSARQEGAEDTMLWGGQNSYPALVKQMWGPKRTTNQAVLDSLSGTIRANRVICANRKFRESETTVKIKFALFRGGGGGQGGREENCPKRYFHGKRHDNKISKVQILLSRNFVVMAQAPRNSSDSGIATQGT